MAVQPLARQLPAMNPGTPGSKRLLPGHAGGPGHKTSPNGAKLQALANIAERRSTGKSGKKLGKKASLGKTLPAVVGMNDGDGDD